MELRRCTSDPKQRFTLLELLIVIAIIGILLTLLLPSLGKARQAAIRAVCASNLSQVSKSYHIYSSQNNYFLISSETTKSKTHAPPWIIHSRWDFEQNIRESPLWGGINNVSTFRCPGETRDTEFENGNYKRSFSINVHLAGRMWVRNIVKTSMEVENPATTLKFLDDADPRGANVGSFITGYKSRWVDWPASNHGDKLINLNFFDGHVQTYAFKDKNTSKIDWFWSKEGYEDRMNFIRFADPVK